MAERLQKIIARAGISSRRAGEELILAGRVRVNGRIITELGAKADLFADTIEVDGRRLVAESPRYIVLHKPRNVVSTLSDPEGRPTVAELLGKGSRLYPVGRLDFATSGVLLVTNDGDFANGLLHPRGGVPKTYVLKVKGLMAEEDLTRWAEGVTLEDGRTLPADVRFLRHEEDKTWFEITIREGRNQQIRRMGEATGFPVMRLARMSFAGISHEGLRPGDFRSLTVDELEELRKQFGVPKKIRGAILGEHGEAPGHRARRAPAREDARGGARRTPLARDEVHAERPRLSVARDEDHAERPRPSVVREEGRAERRAPPVREEGRVGRARSPVVREEGRAERRGPPAREEGRAERRGPPARQEGRVERARPPVREGGRYERRGPPAAHEGGRAERRGPPAREEGRAERARPPVAREEVRADRSRAPAPQEAAQRPAPRGGREAPRPSGEKPRARRRAG